MRPGKSNNAKAWSQALTVSCPWCFTLSALCGMASAHACCHPPRQGPGVVCMLSSTEDASQETSHPLVPLWWERRLNCRGARSAEPHGLFYSLSSGPGPQNKSHDCCMKVFAHRIKEIWHTWTQECLLALLSFLWGSLDLKVYFSSATLWRKKTQG